MSPKPVSGQLLGMSQDEGILEVTDMFPFAPAITDEEEQEAYLLDMLKCFRDINIDHSAVGWYQSVNLDAPIQPAFIESQAAYQLEIPNSCFLVYDHLLSAQGAPSIKAFRLKDTFMQAWKDGQRNPNGRVNQALIAELVEEGIVDELEVFISVSNIDKIILASLIEKGELPEANFLGSENAHRLVLTRLAQNLILSMDDSIAESSRTQHYIKLVGKQQQALAKKLAENAQRIQIGEAPLPDSELQLNMKGIISPPRLGLVLSTAQLSSILGVCEEVVESIKLKQSL